jgi:hypothetical protein
LQDETIKNPLKEIKNATVEMSDDDRSDSSSESSDEITQNV